MKRELRPPTPAERPALAELLSHAFASTPDDAMQWFDRAGIRHLRGFYEGADLVGGLVTVPMGQYFASRASPAMGVAGVAVRPDRRREGLAGAMMRSLLEEAHSRGFAWSTLFPSSYTLYRSVGYACAGTRHTAHILPARCDLDIREPRIIQLEPDDPRIEACHRAVAAQRPGWLRRTPYLWARVRRPRGLGRTWALGVPAVDGGLLGYVIYAKERRPDGFQVLKITDLAARTPGAVGRLWTAIADLGSMVREVEFNTSPTDPFLLALPYPPDARLQFSEHWMIRLVDLPRAIAARGFPETPHATVSLEVDDPNLYTNSGPWTLAVNGGRGLLERGGDARVRVHIRGLAALFSGMADHHLLTNLGLMDGPLAERQRLSELFVGPPPWLRLMF